MRQPRGLTDRSDRSDRRGASALVGVVGLATVVVLAGCTGAPPTASPSSHGASPTSSTAMTSPPATPATSDPTPTFFTPPATGGYSLSGAVTVEQARQDPFSNLLLRGALHQQPVTLDVVATPDSPVTAGRPSEILLGTCRCATRGQGLRVTVSDGAAVRDAGGGRVAIVGRFTVTRTAQDAVTLSPAA